MIRKINGVNLRPFTNSTTYTVSSTTTLTKGASILIPGGTFKAGDLLSAEAMFFKTGTNANFLVYLYFNTSDTLTGATLLGSSSSILATFVYQHFYRRLNIRNVTGGGSGIELGTEVFSTTTNAPSDLTFAGFTAMSNVAINWNNDVYLMFAIKPNNASDTITQRFGKIWLY